MAEATRRERAAAELIANRLRMANNYLQDARTLTAAGSRTSSFCLFMAAELVLLAILASEEIHSTARSTQHQLAAMADQLPDENSLKPAIREIEGLTAYATSFRYTTASGRIPPAMNDADFVAMAKRVDSLVSTCARWFLVPNLDLGSNLPAGNIRPIRG